MDVQVAEELQAQVLRAINEVFSACNAIREGLPQDVGTPLLRQIVSVVHILDADVLEVIYRHHPQLREADPGAFPAIPK